MGQAAAVIRHDQLGGTLQVAGACVVPQPGPEAQDFIQRCAGERGNVREAGKESRVVRQDGGDLRLLQHDLGDPDSIRSRVPLPRQVVPAVFLSPGEQRRRHGVRLQRRLERVLLRTPHALLRVAAQPGDVVGDAFLGDRVARCIAELVFDARQV